MNFSRLKRYFRKHKRSFHVWTMIFCLILGGLAGSGIQYANVDEFGEEDKTETLLKAALKVPGELFLNVLKLIMLPLMISSCIISTGTLPVKAIGWLSLVGALYIIITTLVSAFIGATLAFAMQPILYCSNFCSKIIANGEQSHENELSIFETILDLARNSFPDNIIRPVIEMRASKAAPKLQSNESYYNALQKERLEFLSRNYEQMPNIPGLLFICIVCGMALNALGDTGRPLLNLIEIVRAMSMKCLKTLLWVYPLGIFFRVMASVAFSGSATTTIWCLRYYLTVSGIVLGIQFGLLTLLFYLITKRSPIVHLKKIANILVFGLGTSSSTATLPFIFWEIESVTDADRQALRFFIPFAIPLNKNGAAGALAVVPFLFRYSTAKPVEWWHIIEYSFTTLAYSFATGSLPSASILTVQTILNTLALPESVIYTVIPAEWFMDRLRTMLNIYGNLVGLVVVGEIVRGRLAKNNLRNLCAANLKQMKIYPVPSSVQIQKLDSTNSMENYTNSPSVSSESNGEVEKNNQNGTDCNFDV